MFEAIMKMEDNFLNKMTDVSFPATSDKQSPVMCESLWRWLIKKHCSVSEFYHYLHSLTQPTAELAIKLDWM